MTLHVHVQVFKIALYCVIYGGIYFFHPHSEASARLLRHPHGRAQKRKSNGQRLLVEFEISDSTLISTIINSSTSSSKSSKKKKRGPIVGGPRPDLKVEAPTTSTGFSQSKQIIILYQNCLFITYIKFFL